MIVVFVAVVKRLGGHPSKIPSGPLFHPSHHFAPNVWAKTPLHVHLLVLATGPTDANLP
jgi:hypothetical protein